MTESQKKLFPVILLAAAVLFGFLGFKNTKAQKEYVQTVGTIISIESDYNAGTEQNDYRVTVSYSVNGTPYENRLDTYTADMQVGKTVNILYDPANPNTIVMKGFMGPALYVGFAILCAAVGIYMLAQNRQSTEE